MARIPLTLRIDAKDHAALQDLSKANGRSINQLMNEAVRLYLGPKGRKDREIGATLANLRIYRNQDPGFRNAIAAFVEAEMLPDPLETQLKLTKRVRGNLREKR